VYADWVSDQPSPNPAAGAYRLDKSAGVWDRVADPENMPASAHPSRPRFVGTDGNLLVFKTGWGPSQMAWFQEPLK
jgi:hypothetical protein